jgi:hypothetical protein
MGGFILFVGGDQRFDISKNYCRVGILPAFYLILRRCLFPPKSLYSMWAENETALSGKSRTYDRPAIVEPRDKTDIFVSTLN